MIDVHYTPVYLDGSKNPKTSICWNCKPQSLYLLRKRCNSEADFFSVFGTVMSHSALPNEMQDTCCLLEPCPDFSRSHNQAQSLLRSMSVLAFAFCLLGFVLLCFAETRVHTHSRSSTAVDPLWSRKVPGAIPVTLPVSPSTDSLVPYLGYTSHQPQNSSDNVWRLTC